MSKNISTRAGRSPVTTGACTLLLTGCAAAMSARDTALSDRLFDSAGAAHFRLEYSCTGQVAAETDLCWVPARYFSLWGRERGISTRQIADTGMAASSAAATDAGASGPGPAAEYRVYVRFAPVVIASYTSETNGMGGYKPPRAGYEVDIYTYAADGRLVDHSDYHKKSDAAFMADAVPYVKAGVRTVLAAIDPAYRLDVAEEQRPRCEDRPGRSMQGCGASGR